MTTAAVAVCGASRASAEALLLIEAETGKVLYAENATFPWYPASLTKLMTAYIVLHAVRQQRVTLDSLMTVSQFASVQKPAKMGLKAGMQVTVDNALKMLMVRSANDVAVVIAEGISGSVERFADEMNAAATKLGMTQSSFVNPNGMPAEDQVSSARDLAILARALLQEFPEYDMYWRIPAIRYGKQTTQNYNKLLGRYPGTDGMKTGFICASGFNLVATATRNNRRLIVVILGASSSATRTNKAAMLLERGFNGAGLAWLAPSLGTVETLPPINATPPDLRETICSATRRKPAAENEDDDAETANKSDGTNGDDPDNQQVTANPQKQFKLSNLGPAKAKPEQLLGGKVDLPAIEVYTGPSRKPAESQFSGARAKLNGAKKINKPPGGKSTSLPAAQLAVAPPASVPSANAPTQSDQSADNTPPWMAFAPATPAAAEQPPGMPVPRPRPKSKNGQ